MSLGPVSGKGWTLIAVVRRNASPVGGPTHGIIDNMASGSTGLRLFIDGTTNVVEFSTNLNTVVGTNTWPAGGGPIYIMVRIDPTASTISLYTQGSTTPEKQQSFTGSAYTDNANPPAIGAISGGGLADLQIARLATFDLLVPLSAWSNIYTYGTTYTGR
jgi:hypothetical protein